MRLLLLSNDYWYLHDAKQYVASSFSIYLMHSKGIEWVVIVLGNI